MKTNDVIKKAKKLGIKAGKMKKGDIVRAIQKAEGNFDCFESAIGDCDQVCCTWRTDCIK
ncbi:MAG: SAP domain-containing protein [Nanoarchaeota archaeon]